MQDVKQGDLIIHSYHKKIEAISIALADCYSADRPKNLPDNWNTDGWRIDCEYYPIENPILTSDYIQILSQIQPDKHAPFNSRRRGNTGYLFYANREMFEFILNETMKLNVSSSTHKQLVTIQEVVRINEKIERDQDAFLVDEIDLEIQTSPNQGFEYDPKPEDKPEQVNTPLGKAYKRSGRKAFNAIARAKFQCEIDDSHPSFIRKRRSVNYTEPHHLVPMAFQGRFDHSLDVEANIVSLCSNCHNQLHYGKHFEDLLKTLYQVREKELKKAWIFVTLNELLMMYK